MDKPGAKSPTDVKGDNAFERVSFAYQPRSPVLRGVSFHCEPGKMLALAGPTGVGKTT